MKAPCVSCMQLLARGADIESRDDAGSTPFLVAARAGNLSVLKKLAEHGSSCNVTDSHGDSAIRLVESNTRLKPDTRQEVLSFLTALKEI
jgi:ankyrin repeat protein